MKQEQPISIRLDEAVLAEYRSISARTEIGVATLLRWAAVNYLNDIKAGHVVLMPFADRSHLDDLDPVARAKHAAVADVPLPQSSVRQGSSSKRKAGGS